MFGINAVGRRTGEVLVVLETPEQANLALQRDHHYMQQRYIEVSNENHFLCDKPCIFVTGCYRYMSLLQKISLKWLAVVRKCWLV